LKFDNSASSFQQKAVAQEEVVTEKSENDIWAETLAFSLQDSYK